MRTTALIICFVMILPLSPFFGLSQTGRLNSIELRLMNILAFSAKLEEEQKNSNRITVEQLQKIENLIKELGQLRVRLTVSGTLLKKYRHRVTELLDIISELETKLQQLSESCENTVRPLQEALDIAEKRVTLYKVGIVLALICAVVGVTIAILK